MIETKGVLKARVRILREVGEQLDEQSYQIWREVAFRQPKDTAAALFSFGKALAYAGALFCDIED